MNLFASLQVLLLFFGQFLGLQILFYPLIIFNIFRRPLVILAQPKFMIGFFFMILIAFSLFIRGATTDFVINSMRFYFGLLIVFFAFYANPRLRITSVLQWVFAILCILELLFYYLGITFFTYQNFNSLQFAESRILIGESSARAIGPALNSSVSGTISAVMFFIIIKFGKVKKEKYLLLFLLLALIVTGSTTALIIFILLGFYFFLSILKKNKLTHVLGYFFFIVLALLVLLQIPFFGKTVEVLINSKWNYDYFEVVLNGKYQTLLSSSLASSIGDSFFGADLSMIDSSRIGGDSVMFNFIYLFGWPTVVIYIAYLFYLCRAEFKVFLLAGVISSMHYGTLFTLTGQLFFGALVAGSIYVRRKDYSN